MDKGFKRFGMIMACVKADRGPGQYSRTAFPSGFWTTFSLRGLFSGGLMGSPVKVKATAPLVSMCILTDGSQPTGWLIAHGWGYFLHSAHQMLQLLQPARPWAWATSCFSQAASLDLLLFFFFISLTLGNHPKKFRLLHLLSLSETGKIFIEFLIFLSLPKPKGPNLPWAKRCPERLFGQIQKWPWIFAQHLDDRFSPSPPHPSTCASCRIRKCFIAFFPFHFLYYPSLWAFPSYALRIASLLEK